MVDVLGTVITSLTNWGTNELISSITGKPSGPSGGASRQTTQVASTSPIQVASDASRAAIERQRAGLSASQIDSFQSMQRMVDFVTPKVDIDQQRKIILAQLRRDGASEQFIANLRQQWTMDEKALIEPRMAVDTSTGFAQKPIG